jgi:hypothetical protein
MKSRAARTTLGIVVGGALIAGGAVFASNASAGEEAAAPSTAAKALSPAASENPQQLAHNAAALLGTQQRALSAKQFQAGQTPVAEPFVPPAAAPKRAAAAAPKLADDPTDTTAPTGNYKMSLPSVWIGQRLTLTDLGVFDDVSASENVSRTVDWGDGSTTVLDPLAADPIGKRYYAAGQFTVSVTLIDEAGNSSMATVANAVVTTTKPGKFKISPTSVFNYQRFTLAISSVPAGTTKINVAWGDGYGSSLAGKNQTIGKRYYVRSNGTLVTSGTMTLTATFTNKNGATSAFVIGKVINRRDLTRPVIKFTRPKNANRVSSWSTIRGTATDSGSGILYNKIQILPTRVSTSNRLYCYTPGKRWLLTDDNFTGCAGTFVTVSKGKWSMKLPGLAKGAVLVVGKTYDYSDNTTNDDTTYIYQDLTAK